MMTLLDLLDVLGRATWDPLWIPVLAWSVFALPAWLLLSWTDRLHPLAEYRLSQVLLGSLPLGVLATLLADLLPTSLAAPPVQSFSITVLPAAGAPVETTAAATPWRWTQAVGLLTLGASVAGLIRVARLGLDAVAATRVRASLANSTAPSIRARATRIARRLGTSRSVQVCLTPNAAVPLTLGGRQPTIVLPAALVDRPAALRMTLLHECIHVRRYDDLAHLLERLVVALFVVHPLVPLLHQSIVEARERACDAAVLTNDDHSAADYARLLLSFADGRLHGLDALSLSESPSSLPNRLDAMRSSAAHGLSTAPRLLASLVLAGCFLLFGIVACSDSVSPSTSDEAAASSAPATTENVETPPRLESGMQALREQIEYPTMAQEAGIEGRVFVQFVVAKSGTPRNVQVKQGVHPLLDSAAVTAVRSVTFEPGRKNGTPVPVEMTLPITFQLPADSSRSDSPSENIGAAISPDLEFVFHDLSSEQKEQVLSAPVFTAETRAALVNGHSYPNLVRKAGIDGTVEVSFTLGSDGTPQAPHVTRSGHEALDARVLRSVKTTSFETTDASTNLAGQRISVQLAYRLKDTS